MSRSVRALICMLVQTEFIWDPPSSEGAMSQRSIPGKHCASVCVCAFELDFHMQQDQDPGDMPGERTSRTL